jgi:DNA topoisomerase-3
MTLIIAEKPSVAREIGKAVGASSSQLGYLRGQKYIVTWCIGHLLETAEPDAYDPQFKRWRLDTLPIIPEVWKCVPIPATKKQLTVIQGLVKSPEVTELICATDAGREGELIFRLVYHHLKCKKPFRRLWISSLESSAIRKGLENLKPSSQYDNLYAAALCRQRADWLVGINATRFFSLRSTSNITYHVGRVQTPTLALLSRRHEEIQSFVAKPYYKVTADFGGFKAALKVEDQAVAENMREILPGQSGEAMVKRSESLKEYPPALYDLTTLQRDANRLYGLSAQQTLDAAQALYERKLLTYPRTDSQYITEDLVGSVLELAQVFCERWDITARCDDPVRIVNAGKVSDHHAILPVAFAEAGDMSEPQGKVFTLVVYRLLESLGEPHVYSKTDVDVRVQGHSFTASGRTVREPGFKAIRPQQEKNEETPPPVFPADGTRCVVQGIAVEAKKTKPPKEYTEDTLLEAMEHIGRHIENENLREAVRKGLGTPATRASVIEKLVTGGYVQRLKKQLLPTPKAEALLKLLPEQLKSPELTAEWEYDLDRVAAGTFSPEHFLNDITDMVRQIVGSQKK